ncbi:hypothetical protein PVL29_001992 [Vitis rotundifolia]|uniref:Uncharacterized protein n=1 Tax=Vitis rotundifolia TaxID=103349 RepID=A0AA39E4X9_VITRO|nr:hypothetical protein PVL29_001992 [Vitis rotundifolia]
MDEFVRLTLTLAIVILASSWFKWMFYERPRPPLPPGPRCLPVVGHLPFRDLEFHSYFARLARIHGPIFHLRNELGVVVTSPSLARQGLREGHYLGQQRRAGGGLGHVVRPLLLTMLRRVCVSQMLGSATLNAFYDLRRREVHRMLSYLYSQASPVNVGEQMFLTIMNVMTSMLWRGTVKGGERESLAAEFKQVVAEMTELLGKPNISDFFPGLAPFDLQGIKKWFKALATKLDGVFDPIIAQRVKMDKEGGSIEGKAGKDFLQFLLNLKDEGDSKTPLKMAHVKALLIDMVVGGTDSTSNTLKFAIADMMNKPEVMKKAQQELDVVVGKDSIEEESHIYRLPYLSAVMKEAMRLHPMLPLMVPHCPSETCVVGGYTIPKGVRIFVNVWAIH